MVFQHDIDRVMREIGVDRLQAYRTVKAQCLIRSLPRAQSTNWFK